MGNNEERPEVANQQRGEISCVVHHKDKPKLSKRQRKVKELLSQRKCSAADISIQLGYSDPRSYVRELREKGIVVLDEWEEKADTRFKRYFIEK